MPFEVRIPPPSPKLKKLVLSRWLVAEGDIVTIGQPILEIETSKATADLSSTVSGTIARLKIAEGAQLVGDELAAVIALSFEDLAEVRAMFP